MNLHKKTQKKIMQLFDIVDIFCEQQFEKYEDYPDVLFVINAYEKIFGEFKYKIKMRDDYTVEMYHEEIFNFDSIMSSWQKHLTYYIASDKNDKNDLYSVLFSTLQGVETIIDDDHFYWYEEQDELAQEPEAIEITHIEKEF